MMSSIVKKLLGMEKETDSTSWTENVYKEFGGHIAKGKLLEYRIGLMENFAKLVHMEPQGETLEEQLDSLLEIVKEMDKLVRQGSIAWLRAKSDPDFQRATAGYEALLTESIRDILLVKQGLRESDSNIPSEHELLLKQNQVKNIIRLTRIAYHQQAQFLFDNSFAREDVDQTADKVLVFPVAYQQIAYPPTSGTSPLNAADQLQSRERRFIDWGTPRYPDDIHKKIGDSGKDSD